MPQLFRTCLALALLNLLVPTIGIADDTTTFDRHFTGATMRVDLFHIGNAEEDFFTLDRVFRQGVWAGSRINLIDPFGYGAYRFTVSDEATDALLFSRGFSSYCGEYRTTGPAAEGERRTYHESLLMPFPKQPVHLAVERADGGRWTEVASFAIDPEDVTVSTEKPAPVLAVVEAHTGAPPHQALDLVIVGEGYTSAEESVFRADLKRFTDVLLAHQPFARRKADINVRGILPQSQESGCDEPTHGQYRDTAVGASFNALGSSRYLLTEDNKALRDIAANVPYDAIAIMVNHERYGGGGIYNFYCVFTAHSTWSPYLLLHEFGHSFGGLADEYYTSSVAYTEFHAPDREPVEPNITALLDPQKLKWADLVAEDTPLPTPWRKQAYDAMDLEYQGRRKVITEAVAEAARSGAPDHEAAELEERAEVMSQEATRRSNAFLEASPNAGTVGAFEGAGYMSEGLYRPMLDCIMFSKGVKPWCAVCEQAIERRIDFHAGR